jgi:hypothetical protein
MNPLDTLMETLAIDNHVFNGKNLINVYTCESCKKAIVTVDRHTGTTPFTLLCRATEGCFGVMKSSGYRHRNHVDSWEYPIDYEFFRPLTEDECASVRAQIHLAVERDLADSGITSPTERDELRDDLASVAARFYTRGGLALRRYTGRI